MTQSIRDLENTFLRAAKLLVRNPIVLLPGILLAVVNGALDMGLHALTDSFVLFGPGGNANIGYARSVAVTILAALISLFVSLIQMLFVTGMATAAWQRSQATLRDGFAMLSHRWLPLLGLMAAMFTLGLIAAPLAPFTFGVSLVAYIFFCLYAVPAVTLGNHAPIQALFESAQIALENAWPTLAVVLLLFVIAAITGGISGLFAAVSPIVGKTVEAILEQLTVCYVVFVVVGEYLKLRHQTSEG